MKRVIRFTRLRYTMPAISFSLILIGFIGTIVHGGFNLGIDFKAGLQLRIQIAPTAMAATYTGANTEALTVSSDKVSLKITGTDNRIVTHDYLYTDYPTIGQLQSALDKNAGLAVTLHADASESSSKLLSTNGALTLGSTPSWLNLTPGTTGSPVTIGEVRNALISEGAPAIQEIGSPANQEYSVRTIAPAGQTEYNQKDVDHIQQLLEKAFGQGTIVVRQSSYVGPRFSKSLGQQSAYLSIVAVAVILVYTWFRFKLAYSFAAIMATLHDTLFMFAFIGFFQVEFSTATIAAILTIIGYSLNDTIVIFDRIRENTGLMRGFDRREIVDSSVTQTLSRTTMTSLTTLLAVLAIFVFGTGTIKDFALALIVGVVVGTYSSVFVASPILIGWLGLADRRRRRVETKAHGGKAGEMQKASTPAPVVSSSDSGEDNKVVEIPFAERRLKGKRRKKR